MGANCRTVVWKPDDHAATQQKHTGDQETIEAPSPGWDEKAWRHEFNIDGAALNY